MSIIGMSLGQSDILLFLYVVLVLGVLLLFRRHLLINAMGIADILVATIVVAMTFSFVRTYSVSERRYIPMWRFIHRELAFIRKTYGVVEVRLVFHFLIKRVQVKSFYEDSIDPQLGIDIIHLVELWSRLIYRDLAAFNLDATYRVRIICLERAIKAGLKDLR